MSKDAGRDIKARLRADLRAAMENRHKVEMKVIRTLLAAIDNAEAPRVQAGPTASVRHDFHSGSAEIERLLLNQSDVQRVLSAEIEECERIAAELQGAGMPEQAESLLAEALLAKRYLD